MKYKTIPAQGKITAYYDLKSAPITFDFVYFLASAVCFSKAQGLNYLDLVVVADAWRVLTPREKAYSDIERTWRLWNLIAQVAQICPHVRNFAIQRSPLLLVNPDCYPRNYNPRSGYVTPYAVRDVVEFFKSGVDVKCFSASKRAKAFAAQIVNADSRVVTLSPRTAGFDAVRDSNLEFWFQAYSELRHQGFNVIVIPDQDDVLSFRRYSQFDWHVLPEASMNLDIKLAIYEKAVANVVASGGNVGPLLFSNVSFAIVRTLNEASHVSTAKFHESQGFPPGSQYPWFSEKQCFTWGGDSAEEIVLCAKEQVRN
jgi:hypothetical protein